MMSILFDWLLKGVQFIERLSLPIAVTSWILTYRSSWLRLGDKFSNDLESVQSSIAAVFILSSAITIFSWVCKIAAWINRKNTERNVRAEEVNKIRLEELKIIERLDYLSGPEIEVIRQCLKVNSQTFTSSIVSAAAISLYDKGIVYSKKEVIIGCPFHFRDFVWKYIQNNRGRFLNSH